MRVVRFVLICSCFCIFSFTCRVDALAEPPKMKSLNDVPDCVDELPPNPQRRGCDEIEEVYCDTRCNQNDECLQLFDSILVTTEERVQLNFGAATEFDVYPACSESPPLPRCRQPDVYDTVNCYKVTPCSCVLIGTEKTCIKGRTEIFFLSKYRQDTYSVCPVSPPGGGGGGGSLP